MLDKSEKEILIKISNQVSNMDVKINRLESKINNILEIIEVFFQDEDDEEDELIEDYDECWLPDQDAWKNEED